MTILYGRRVDATIFDWLHCLMDFMLYKRYYTRIKGQRQRLWRMVRALVCTLLLATWVIMKDRDGPGMAVF